LNLYDCITTKLKLEQNEYELVGVVVEEEIHTYSYVRERTYDKDNNLKVGDWYKCYNDSVSKVSTEKDKEEMEHNFFGGPLFEFNDSCSRYKELTTKNIFPTQTKNKPLFYSKGHARMLFYERKKLEPLYTKEEMDLYAKQSDEIKEAYPIFNFCDCNRRIKLEHIADKESLIHKRNEKLVTIHDFFDEL
jgi:hypothetical protein